MAPSNESEILLNLITSSVTGSFDHLQTFLRMSENASDMLTYFVSMHESDHLFLNNQTAYGALMMAYADLHHVIKGVNDRYLNILKILVGRCREPHEIYATYTAASIFSGRIGVDGVREMLKDEPDYLSYFEQAHALVGSIKSGELRDWIFFNCIRWCFQSKSIANLALANLDKFKIRETNDLDFPDRRWRYLIANFTGDSISDAFIVFLEANANDENLQGFGEHLIKDTELNLSEIKYYEPSFPLTTTFFMNLFNGRDPYINLPSFPGDEHILYFTKLFAEMERMYPSDKYYHPLKLNTDPYNHLRTNVMQKEQESIWLTDKLLHCKIRKPMEYNAETRQVLLAGEILPFLIMARDVRTLNDQYIFEDGEIPPLLTSRQRSVVFTRFFFNDGSEPSILFIPFEDPTEIQNFISEMPENKQLVVCIGLSSLLDTKNQLIWETYFDTQALRYYLNDLSIIYSLEQIFQNQSDVVYTTTSFEVKKIHYYTLTFRFRSQSGKESIMICPCTRNFQLYVESYMEDAFPSILNNLELTEEQELHIYFILISLFSEESKWTFRRGLVIHKLF